MEYDDHIYQVTRCIACMSNPCRCPDEQPRADVNDRQVGGTHYESKYQHWDFVIRTGQSYLQGCATKYISRWRKKNGLVDLEKSLHYIDKLEASKLQKIPFEAAEVFLFADVNNLTAQEVAAICAILAHQWDAARSWINTIIRRAKRADAMRNQPT